MLSTGEASFAQEYLEVEEYGLALETIVDDWYMRKVLVLQTIYREIGALSNMMEDLIDERLSAVLIE